MSIFGAAAGYTLGATVATNFALRSEDRKGFVGPLESVIFSGVWWVPAAMGAPVLKMITPFAGGVVGAYMGYTQKIPILRDYV